jgi:hypothetical protein
MVPPRGQDCDEDDQSDEEDDGANERTPSTANAAAIERVSPLLGEAAAAG